MAVSSPQGKKHINWWTDLETTLAQHSSASITSLSSSPSLSPPSSYLAVWSVNSYSSCTTVTCGERPEGRNNASFCRTMAEAFDLRLCVKKNRGLCADKTSEMKERLTGNQSIRGGVIFLHACCRVYRNSNLYGSGCNGPQLFTVQFSYHPCVSITLSHLSRTHTKSSISIWGNSGQWGTCPAICSAHLSVVQQRRIQHLITCRYGSDLGDGCWF